MSLYAFAGLRFDAADGRLSAASGTARTQLRPQVARLLSAFVEHPGSLIDREQLCRAVWDEGTVVDFESGLAAVLRELRAELKAVGAPADLIETVPRRGYRLRASVQRQQPGGSAWSKAGRKRVFGLTAALALLIVVGILAWPGGREPVAPIAQHWTLAVLPFSQFGEPAQGPRRLDLLLADMLLVQLWELRLPDVTLIGRASLAPYAGRDQIAAAVARDLGVNLLIEGSVVFESDTISVSARLLEMPGGRIVWSETRGYEAGAAPSAAEIAAELSASLVRAWSAPAP